MATDRELLELAAKAAGIEVADWHRYGHAVTSVGDWNPLTDDGDALRLAVTLKLHISVQGDMPGDEQITFCGHGWDGAQIKAHGADAYAATRRAIVRCAAEIGRTM